MQVWVFCPGATPKRVWVRPDAILDDLREVLVGKQAQANGSKEAVFDGWDGKKASSVRVLLPEGIDGVTYMAHGMSETYEHQNYREIGTGEYDKTVKYVTGQKVGEKYVGTTSSLPIMVKLGMDTLCLFFLCYGNWLCGLIFLMKPCEKNYILIGKKKRFF